jgi:hypothetical protein
MQIYFLSEENKTKSFMKQGDIGALQGGVKKPGTAGVA